MERDAQSIIQEQGRTLLDRQLNNLSERLFETGKRVDAMLTTWLTLTALTILICFGVIDTVSIGGLELKSLVAATVTFSLTCAYYYRIAIGISTLGFWRNELRNKRRERFRVAARYIIEGIKTPEHKIDEFVISGINEYPGYIASSVRIKNESKESKNWVSRILIPFIYYTVIFMYSLSPYILGFALIHRAQYSLSYIPVVVIGLIICLSANAIIGLEPKK